MWSYWQDGGGSIEDLWPFNEEAVANAIYDSKLPVISAVGHETDFTIADFVADLRAPTPSAAAELAVPNITDYILKLESYQARYKMALKKKTEFMKLRYEKCMTRRVFKEPMQQINEQYMIMDMEIKKITNAIITKLNNAKARANEIYTKLDSLSPLKTLARGYTLTTKDGKLIKSSKALKKDDTITIRFEDGQNKAKILE